MKNHLILLLAATFAAGAAAAQTGGLPSEEELAKMRATLEALAAEYNGALQGLVGAAEGLAEEDEVQQRLMRAIAADDVAELRSAEAAGADLFRSTEFEGATTVMYAAAQGSLNALKHLQRRGVPLDARTATNENALVWAVSLDKSERGPAFAKKRQNKAAVIRYLIAAGMDGNGVIIPGAGTRIIHYAGIQGFPEAVAALKASGVDLDGTNALGQTALHFAAGDGDLELVRALAEAGAGINREAVGLTPFDAAERSGSAETARYLASRGAKRGSLGAQIGALESERKSPRAAREERAAELFAACAESDAAKLRGLLDAGADPNGGLDGMPPLHAAAVSGFAEGVRLLLARGSRVDAVAADGTTALGMACMAGSAPAAEALLRGGADPNRRSGDLTPLALAKALGHTELERLIRAAGGR